MRSPLPESACAALVALAALAGGGCGDSTSRTYPVEGKVVFKGKPPKPRDLVGVKVRFRSTADPKITAVGTVEADGIFSLGTVYKEKGLPGALAGQYRARVEVPR